MRCVAGNNMPMPYYSSDDHVFLTAWHQTLTSAGETLILQAMLHTCLCCYNGRASSCFRCLLIPPLVFGVTLACLDTRSSCSSSNNRRGAMGVMPDARTSLSAQDVQDVHKMSYGSTVQCKLAVHCKLAIQWQWQYNTAKWQYSHRGSPSQTPSRSCLQFANVVRHKQEIPAK